MLRIRCPCGSNRGQGSLEFLNIFILMLIFFTITSLFIFFSSTFYLGMSNNVPLYALGEKICKEINNAFLFGSGYNKKLFLPPTIFDKNYSLAFSNSTAEISTNDGFYSCNLLGKVVVDRVKKGGYMTIVNVDGVVYIV